MGTGLGALGSGVLALGGVSEGEVTFHRDKVLGSPHRVHSLCQGYLFRQPLAPQVTLLGDLACLAASCAVVAYLSIGRRLRAWMPLFVYAAPVTGDMPTTLDLCTVHPAKCFQDLPSTYTLCLILLGVVIGVSLQ